MQREPILNLFHRLRSASPPRLLFVYAHPDDEIIAVGGHLPLVRDALFLQVTDGAPADNADGNRLHLARDEYRATRALELRAAFAAAGLPEARHRCLNYADKQATLHLRSLTEEVARTIAAEQPEYIFTHPYEAGHADHDACAFAVHHAVAASSHPRPVILESPFYFRNPDGSMHTGSFLREDGNQVTTVSLSDDQQERKQAAFAAFGSQRDVLAAFDSVRTQERFRIAPSYDFTRLPSPGPALYETFIAGMTAVRFTQLAAKALQSMRSSAMASQAAAPKSLAA